MIVADRLAKYVTEVFAVDSSFSGFAIFLAALLFWLQLLYDFSAYCDIAVGVARIFGVKLSRNFYNHIYVDSFTRFWKEWHITLTDWFRNYVFFVLVQYNRERWFWYVSLFLTFTLTGLWHGANWTFVLWGALNGIFLIVEHLTIKSRSIFFERTGLSRLPRLKFVICFMTFLLISIFPSLLFRSENLNHFWSLAGRMFDWSGFNWDIGFEQGEYLGIFGVLICTEWLNIYMGKRTFNKFCNDISTTARWFLYLVLIYSLLSLQVFGEEFVYYEF